MKRIKKVLGAISAEILLTGGAFFIVWAGFLLDETVGFYSIGAIFTAAGLLIAKHGR